MAAQLYFCRLPKGPIHSFSSAALERLPDEKQKRLLRMQPEDALPIWGAHMLLYHALQDAFGYSLNKEDYRIGAHEKPYLAKGEIHFNLSHSGDMVLCGADTSPIGVDIQEMRPFSGKLPQKIFCAEELEAYQSSSNKEAFFYQVWVLKESYIKRDGRGLSYGLKNICCYPQANGVIHSNDAACQFTLLEAPAGYQAGCCTQKTTLQANWVPFSKLLEAANAPRGGR